MNNSSNKSPQGLRSLLQGGVLEIVFIVLLASIILLSLNYFNLVPLSQTFSFLSFLPQQGTIKTQLSRTEQRRVSPTQKVKTPTIRHLITPNDPKTFMNKGKEHAYELIPNSEIKILSKMTVDIELSMIGGKEVADSAFFFHNGLSKSKKDYRFLRLFYWREGGNWSLQYHSGEKDQYSGPILFAPSGKIYGKFTLIISPDGREVTISLSTGEAKTMKLIDSLYSVTNQMGSMIQVASGSSVTVSSLSYRYSTQY